MYGIGILGNCCTHGAGAVAQVNNHPKTDLITGFEGQSRRGHELAEAMGVPLASGYDEVIHHPDIQILIVTSNPCDKADLIEKAAAAGKAIFVNKPLCHSPEDAKRIVRAIEKHGTPAVFDAPMIKGISAYDCLLKRVRAGEFGRIINYHHSFGMLFDQDFPIAKRWPERFDPPSVSGGGEMTNMGCYAIDFALRMLGLPLGIQARSQTFWEPYSASNVENFGQILLDYGSYWAMLTVGKQTTTEPRSHRNALTIEFETGNIFLDAQAGVLMYNGASLSLDTFVGNHQPVSAMDQLIASLEKGSLPESDIYTAARGVDVLCAGYQSVIDGQPVDFPMQEPVNPLIER